MPEWFVIGGECSAPDHYWRRLGGRGGARGPAPLRTMAVGMVVSE